MREKFNADFDPKTLVNENPLLGALISKFNKPKSSDKLNTYEYINYNDIVKSTYNKIKDNDTLVKLFPDSDLAMQIVISSILSPNDLVTESLTLSIPDIAIPADIKKQLLDVITEHLRENYKFMNELYTIIEETLFTKGAYAEIIIPEASLDRLINGDLNGLTIESFSRLGNKANIFEPVSASVSLALESNSYKILNKRNDNKPHINILPHDLNIEFTDDINILRYSKFKLNQIARESRIERNQKVIEKENEKNKLLDSFFRLTTNNTVKKTEFILRDEENLRDSIGLPFVVKVPIEAIIPIYGNNDPTHHVGYFVLLDDNGDFVTMQENVTPNDCNNYLNNDFKSMLINKYNNNVNGNSFEVPKIKEMDKLYDNVIEEMIKNRLRNSKYEDLVDVSNMNNIYKIMLSRSLKDKKTKLLFVPEDLMQYYAFNYRDNGTGESIMEKSTYLYSIASALLLTNFKAQIDNAIPMVNADVKIDDRERDLKAATQQIASNLLKTREGSLPLGVINLNELTDWLNRQNININFEHPNLPNTKITYSSSNLDRPTVDNEFLKDINAMIHKTFGVTPEMVDSSKEKEFATSIANDNKLFAKRIIRLQEKLEHMLTKHIRKILFNDRIISESIKNIVVKNKKTIKDNVKKIAEYNNIKEDDFEKIKDSEIADYICDFFISKIYAELARPETGSSVTMENLDSYIDKMDKLIDNLFNNDAIISETFKEFADKIDHIKGIIKSQLFITYVNKNNLWDELTSWVTLDENGNPNNPIFENHIAFTKTVMKEYKRYLESVYPVSKENAKELEKLKEKFDSFGDEDSSSDDSYGDDSSGDEDSGIDGEEGDSEGGDESGDDWDMDDENSSDENNDDTESSEDTNSDTEDNKDDNKDEGNEDDKQ